jgi:hypothetical protein
MGVVNKFQEANDYLRLKLGYHLDPVRSDNFRSLLNLAGIRRVKHAIDLVQLEGHTAAANPDIHRVVTERIWAIMPARNPARKYRNPQVEATKKLNLEQERELEYAMERDRS